MYDIEMKYDALFRNVVSWVHWAIDNDFLLCTRENDKTFMIRISDIQTIKEV